MELRNSFVEGNKILLQYKGQWYLIDGATLAGILTDAIEHNDPDRFLREDMQTLDPNTMTDSQRFDYILNWIFMNEDYVLPLLKDYRQ